MKLFYTLLMFCICFSISSQNMTEKQKESEKNEVDIFTPEEKDNIQRWFYEETNKLGLSEDKRTEYDRILSDNIFDIRRLDDKDKDYSQSERDIKFEKLVNKTNSQVKAILTDKQYKKHLKSFSKLVRDTKLKQLKN